ncbi:hypothetical protein [Staphylococcus epidermidis]|nr:hypothetical protein [Staphylococcus epidermidis]
MEDLDGGFVSHGVMKYLLVVVFMDLIELWWMWGNKGGGYVIGL